jgi:hypothetical protein
LELDYWDLPDSAHGADWTSACIDSKLSVFICYATGWSGVEWGPSCVASIMLITLTVVGWCVLPVSSSFVSQALVKSQSAARCSIQPVCYHHADPQTGCFNQTIAQLDQAVLRSPSAHQATRSSVPKQLESTVSCYNRSLQDDGKDSVGVVLLLCHSMVQL